MDRDEKRFRAALGVCLASQGAHDTPEESAKYSVAQADALLAELDRTADARISPAETNDH